ncbi:MAG: ATP-binding cassette domain-containing protein [Oscillospiraceae bacterium]|nr:ATP-binding cassette domain-containing protein [Oscillospiraceae bacterium]
MSLEVRNLTKHYGDKLVLDHLSFTMPGPGVYALLGTNGAGKTTAIRMMLGMLARDEGEALWNGQPLKPETCNVGYLAEERGLYPKYRLLDQLLYFAALRGVSKSDAMDRIRYWSRRLETDEYLFPARRGPRGSQTQAPSLKADQLSKGNQQKIQLMLALLPDPELLILDEPLSGLDPVNTDLFKSILREEIGKGKYMILSSHQMPTVEEFCTDITILDRSRTILQGNLNEIKKAYGRVNLRLKTEEDAEAQIRAAGIEPFSEKPMEYELRVAGDGQANDLLRRLAEAGIRVVTFNLREPSLHEIFVEKVGKADAAE